jgi:hypothetical protein
MKEIIPMVKYTQPRIRNNVNIFKPSRKENISMKRFILSILILLAMASPAQAITTYNVDALTGGAQRALDYISVNDLNNGDRSIAVFRSGVTDYYLYFKYDASGVTAEQTASHPYYIRPNDYVASGVWVEVAPNWIAFGTSLSIQDLTVSNTLTTNKVASSGWLSGGVPWEYASGTSTVSGTTLYGGYIYGDGTKLGSAMNGTTRYLPTATGNGENVVFFTVGNTFTSGGTLYVHFQAGDTVYSTQTITPGVSKFIIASTETWGKQVLVISPAANRWIVKTVGTPSVDWD